MTSPLGGQLQHLSFSCQPWANNLVVWLQSASISLFKMIERPQEELQFVLPILYNSLKLRTLESGAVPLQCLLFFMVFDSQNVNVDTLSGKS